MDEPKEVTIQTYQGWEEFSNIEKSDKLPPGVFKNRVPGSGRALVGFMAHQDSPGPILDQIMDDRPGGICGTIIDNDHIEVGPGLTECAGHRTLNGIFSIVAGNADGDTGL